MHCLTLLLCCSAITPTRTRDSYVSAAKVIFPLHGVYISQMHVWLKGIPREPGVDKILSCVQAKMKLIPRKNCPESVLYPEKFATCVQAR